LTSAARAASPVALAQIAESLANAGLLISQSNALPETIAGISDDSRSVGTGDLFIAVRGHVQDGHHWLPQAALRGASCAIVEDESATTLPALVVRDGRRAAAIAAAAFFDWPAHALTLLGVTGTNGKTTTVDLIRHLLSRDHARAASIGTLGVLVGSEGAPFPGGSGLTTPGPVELQRILRALVRDGITSVTMEVSSHSLEQRRVEGLSFAAGVFTNLTRDHLDYHGTMEGYFRAKSRLVGLLAKDGWAIVNADDPAWRALPAANHALTFGLGVGADVGARDIRYHTLGSEFLLVTNGGAAPVSLPLIGEFNIANALGAAAAALSVGVSLANVAEGLSRAPQVPGRLEKLRVRPTVLRDYSHTPDSLERAIAAVRPFASAADSESGNGAARGRLIVVFGCGGDRDRGKRPLMGEIAERLGDYVILTSDNPRREEPERILDDIEAGMTRTNHTRIEDRRDAIAHSLRMAHANDVVLLAGKGHETYQIRGTSSLPFDEKQIVAELSEAM
jgi:UDP-N-acetylmuramoyl-L-alanyl-D-glutamate--2,6-diaminopimelate ligase